MGEELKKLGSDEIFEGFGGVWDAIFGEATDIVKQLPSIINEAKLDPKNKLVRDDGSQICLLHTPDDSPIRMGSLLVAPLEEKSLELWSFYPLLEGLPSKLSISEVAVWENGVEASILAEQPGGGPSLSFFAPHHFREQAELSVGNEVEVYLAALALKCSIGEANEFTVNEGPFYEMQLKEFLEEHPDKTQADFKAPVFSMNGSRMFLPTGYASEWQFRWPVEEVPQMMTLRGEEIQRVKIGIPAGTDGELLPVYLYIPRRQLDKELHAGDDIEGVFWLSGYVHKTSAIGEQN